MSGTPRSCRIGVLAHGKYARGARVGSFDRLLIGATSSATSSSSLSSVESSVRSVMSGVTSAILMKSSFAFTSGSGGELFKSERRGAGALPDEHFHPVSGGTEELESQ